jgi:phosphatidylinositol alpha-1,6-mannosyltransferase
VNSPLLYLVPNLFGPAGGIGRYCRLVCRALLGAGVPFAVVALSDSQATTPDAAVIPTRGECWPCHGSRGAFVLRALREAAKRRPGVVLVGHPNFAPLGWFVARLTGACMVTFVYGIDAWEPLPPIRRWALQHSSRVIAISRFTARRAQEANKIPGERVRILHNCLDPEFERQPEPSVQACNLSLLTVGRMSRAERYKGHDYVIRAMPFLLHQFPGLIYNVVGDGDGRSELEQLAQQLGVRQDVRFHGFVSESELLRYYAQASVFVMPSRAEGFGFVFLEAMSQGIPVIGGVMDATPEVVADGETGYLVDPTSVTAIESAISRLLCDDRERLLMGQAGRRRALQEFGFPLFQERLLSLLSESIANQQRSVTEALT